MAIWHFVYRILAFTGTSTAVGMLAAFIAWALYGKRRRDQRRDAAKIVLREIEHAEEQVPEVKKALQVLKEGGEPDSIRLLTVDNWQTAQYLLAGQLPDDVMRVIDKFYTNCRLIDEALVFIDGVFAKNEAAVRDNTFRVLADYVAKALDDYPDNVAQATAEAIRKRDIFTKIFTTLYSYRPAKPSRDIEKNLELLPIGLAQGRVGEHLRLLQLGPIRRILAGRWFLP